MATKAKEEKSWQSKNLAQWKQSKTSTWRAQTSTSPTGVKFVGVRQYVTKADGTEIVTKSGIAFLAGKESLEAIDQMIKLFTALKGKASDREEKPEPKVAALEKKPRKKKPEPEASGIYGLINGDETKWMISWRSEAGSIKIRSTETEEEAKSFESEEAAAAYLKQARALGLKSAWRVVRLD